MFTALQCSSVSLYIFYFKSAEHYRVTRAIVVSLYKAIISKSEIT